MPASSAGASCGLFWDTRERTALRRASILSIGRDRGQLDLYEYFVGPLPENEIRGIMKQVFAAIGFCHDNSIAHRDLKPENVRRLAPRARRARRLTARARALALSFSGRFW